MYRRLSVVIVALLTLLVLSPVAAQPLAAPQCFSTIPGISNCIDGRFNSFWNGNGGLPVFGYPITAQHEEVNADLQMTFQTQWFERNRFEQHLELAAPYDVLLGRLGAELLLVQGRDWHNESNNSNQLGGTCQHFDATNRDVCGPFLGYWLGHGLNDPKLDAYGKSLALFGLPLTGVKMEMNPNGDTVLTQWFERARFELHPEVGNSVLLGLLGHDRTMGASPPTPQPTLAATPVPTAVAPLLTPVPPAPTPVPPAPTKAPPPSGTLRILSNSNHITSGYIYIVGEVLNDTSKSQEYVKIVASLYDKGGTLVGTSYGYTLLDILTAGQRSPFSILLDSPSATLDHYTLQVQGREATSPPLGGLVVVSSSDRDGDSSDTHYVVGEVRNDSGGSVQYFKIIVTEYDGAGKVVGVDYGYTSLDVLTAGQSSPFEVLSEYWVGIARYVVQTQGRRP